MAEFLKTLLLMSLLGSALAVLLTLLRPLIAGRRVYYCLWLLVLARLCLPVGVAISLPGGEPAQAPAAETISEAWTAEPAWQGSGLRLILLDGGKGVQQTAHLAHQLLDTLPGRR